MFRSVFKSAKVTKLGHKANRKVEAGRTQKYLLTMPAKEIRLLTFLLSAMIDKSGA